MTSRNLLAWLLFALFMAVGLALIFMALLPYESLKALTSSLTTDHQFNSLKPGNASVFKVLFGVGGLFFLGLAALTVFRGWRLVGHFLKRLWTDMRSFFSRLRFRKDGLPFLAVVLVIMALAVIYRLERIVSPMYHDEAYTYVAFGHSWFAALTDYHLPNNHVFHSLLVYVSTRLFGLQPWAVRLPALTAGVLLVPAAYWLARRFYDRWTALGTALLVAWSPALISYSDNARGYTLVALFTLLVLGLGDLVRKEKNFFAWGLISLFSALGLYTVPVMLFPFGILFVWLFLENWAEGPGPYRTKQEFVWYWLAAGFGAALLTLLFYTPILIFTGPEKLFANGFVTPLPWADLLETLVHRFAETWAEWTLRIPLFVVVLLVLGWISSLIFHRRLSPTRVPLQLAGLLWIVVLLLIQRPNAWSKVWVFLLPLMLIWAAAGIFGLLQKVRLGRARSLSLAAVVFGAALLTGIGRAVWLTPQFPDLWAGRGGEEDAVLFVQSQLQPGDLILVAPTDDAAVWYYSDLHGIPETYFDTDNLAFERALVLVDPGEGQTIMSVIADRGPDQETLSVESARLLQTFGKMEVYEVPRR